jgi:hypothetical protein
VDGWRILHSLALIWLGAGLGATYPLIVRAWASKDVKYQMYCLVEAANNETRILLPGALATGITGFFWAAAEGYDFVEDGWLAALALLFVLFYFVCLLASLVAAKKGVETDELREVLNDRVPVVFATLLVLSVPLMAWIAIFKPL